MGVENTRVPYAFIGGPNPYLDPNEVTDHSHNDQRAQDQTADINARSQNTPLASRPPFSTQSQSQQRFPSYPLHSAGSSPSTIHPSSGFYQPTRQPLGAYPSQQPQSMDQRPSYGPSSATAGLSPARYQQRPGLWPPSVPGSFPATIPQSTGPYQHQPYATQQSGPYPDQSAQSMGQGPPFDAPGTAAGPFSAQYQQRPGSFPRRPVDQDTGEAGSVGYPRSNPAKRRK